MCSESPPRGVHTVHTQQRKVASTALKLQRWLGMCLSLCVCARLHTVSLQREPHLVFPRHILHPEPHGALAVLHGGTRVQHLHQILSLHLASWQAMGDPDA